MTYQQRQKLGNYRLVRLLGSGGFAEVYLARHIYLQTQAAIKVLQIQLTTDALQNFLKEARIIANLEHPNIVHVLEFGIENARPYLVMNHAPNGTLRQLYPRGRVLGPIAVQALLNQIVAGLEYAHEHKIIHRDIKPENMLLSANNTVLLSDFGLALEGQSAYYSQPTDKAGTMLYMAPEQFRGNPCSASDQYSLGIVVYEWLSGVPPFAGTGLAVAVQHAQNEPPPLHQHLPDLPKEISNIVMRTLRKDPQERYPHIRDFANAFTEACERYRDLLPHYEDTPLLPETREEEPSTADTIAQLSAACSLKPVETRWSLLHSNPLNNVTASDLSPQPRAQKSATASATRQLSSQEQQAQHFNNITSTSKMTHTKRSSHRLIVLCGISALILCLSGFWEIHQPEPEPQKLAQSVHIRQVVTTTPTLTQNKTSRPKARKTTPPAPLQANIQDQSESIPQTATATPQTKKITNTPETTPSQGAKPDPSPVASPSVVVKATASPSVVTGQVSGRLNVSIGSVPAIVQNGSSVSVQIITNTGNCQVSLQVIYSNASQAFKSPNYVTDSSGNTTINWNVSVNPQSMGKYTLATLIVSARDDGGRTAISVPTIVQVV